MTYYQINFSPILSVTKKSLRKQYLFKLAATPILMLLIFLFDFKMIYPALYLNNTWLFLHS